MRIDTVSKLEVRSQVGQQQFLLGALANQSQNLLVQIGLILFALLIGFPLFLLLTEHIGLSALLGGFFAFHLEVFVVDVVRYFQRGTIVQLGTGHNDVLLVHTTQWAFVHCERTIDEQQTRSELLEEDNTLATVTTSQDNQNTTWFQT